MTLLEGREEEVTNYGCHTSPVARTDPLGRIDQKDHQGAGNDRDVAYQ